MTPLYSDRCSRHADVLEPGNCGACKDVRVANEQRPRLALVATEQCLIYLEPDANHCRGCAADAKASETA